MLQSNLDYPDLNNPDFSFIRTLPLVLICPEYPLVMVEIRSHNLFKTTALKSEVKAGLFRFKKA